MDDEDDSVIFQNSPLDQYLTEIGCESQSVVREKRNTIVHVKAEKPSRIWMQKWTDFVERWSNSFADETFQNLDSCYRNSILETVLTSNLLEDDDRNILENFVTNSPGEIRQTNNILQNSWLSSFMVLLLACLIGFVTTFPFSLCVVLIELVLTLGLLYCSCLFWRNRRRINFWNKQILEINSFIVVEKCLNSELRKILQHIRDREILNQGYTLVTKFATISDRMSTVPFSNAIPLANIRELLLNCVLDLFHNCRASTNQMLATKNANLFNNDFVLAKLDEKLFLGFLDSTDERLTITALKTCCQYFSLQRSEFLRFWTLSRCTSLLVGNEFPRQKKSYKLDDSYLSDLANKSKFVLEKLQTITKIYSPRTVLESNNGRHFLLSDAKTDAIAALRSLKLHLQVALEKILNLPENGDNDQLDENIKNLLPLLESDVKASLSCINEIREQIEKKQNKYKIELVTREPNENKEVITRIIHEEYEPLIEDQVFEAFTCRNDEQSERVSDIGDTFQSENSIISRHNLLDELKSVLRVRSTTMHDRELRAIASNRGIPLEDLIKEEEDQSSSTGDERGFKCVDVDKLPSSNSTTERFVLFSQRTSDDDVNDAEPTNPFNVNLADELKRALLARSAFTGRNFEEQIGDDDDD